MLGNNGRLTKQTKNKRFDMTLTPDSIFDKNQFVYALDLAPDFNRALFDCIAGIKKETVQDKMAFQDVETVMHDLKKFYVMWEIKSNSNVADAKSFLYNTVFVAKRNPETQQAKDLIDLWKSIYLFFPHKERSVDSVTAFGLISNKVLQNILSDGQAQYHVLHAFAHHAGLTKGPDIKRAFTLVANNEFATVNDLQDVLHVRDDMDEKYARMIVERCKNRVETLQKLPVTESDNRSSGAKDSRNERDNEIKQACLDGMMATSILLSLAPKYAIDMKQYFQNIMDRMIEQAIAARVQMPDINDLSQFPHYAAVLQQVKSEQMVNNK